MNLCQLIVHPSTQRHETGYNRMESKSINVKGLGNAKALPIMYNASR